ncbi:MAG: D-3-phosphoglycerate dehydrogenase [Candidatus Saccharicenans subterraneus]|uniref:D-3-phosphoglycerate dehydrogenase n=1 Tax=Candidatus Saccharicenans subterraneus TaxID=2508984 RepID=A0A3E2BMY7_9BACT|nr:MAG: D-3-phosphoglycerate dehydrogenase [Candidatus Saccharicenans subterraneum]
MTKILVADTLDKEAVAELQKVPGFEVTVKTGLSETELVQIIPEFEVAVVRSATKITRPVIEAGKNLKLLIRAGIGLDNIDVAAAKEKGIEVANTPAATSISVAEHTLGLMLGAVRHHGPANLTMKQHKWEKKAFTGTELYGKTLGIIGFGRIGKEVARRALAFGMTVLAYDVIQIATDLPVKQVSLEELIKQADIITLHVPKTQKPILGEAEFAMMKDGVVIVNVARGGVVDEKALLQALNSGKVKAAALDVFEKEPPEDFSLIDHPRVTATPHLGAAAEEGQKRAGMEVVRILKEKFAKS